MYVNKIVVAGPVCGYKKFNVKYYNKEGENGLGLVLEIIKFVETIYEFEFDPIIYINDYEAKLADEGNSVRYLAPAYLYYQMHLDQGRRLMNGLYGENNDNKNS